MTETSQEAAGRINLARSDHGISVYLIEERDGRRVIRKEYDRPTHGFRVECDFYRRATGRAFEYLRLAELIEAGERHLLLEYVPRQVYTRDSILERSWSDSDVDLFVSGLLEFHQLTPPRRLFSASRRLIGSVYPILRTSQQLRKWTGTLTTAQRATAARLIAAYAVHRPLVAYVCTHFDLQTYNYTFAEGGSRMSLLDFEFPYRKGDPYFDILYYISIPICEIREWTFQKKLLKAFFERVQRFDGYNPARKIRTRLLLLLANLARHSFFREDAVRRAVYERNVGFILDDAAFDAFWTAEL